MAELGFEKSAMDDSLYILRDAEGQTLMVVLAYVNDTIPAGPNLTHIIKFKKDFSECLKITDLGDIHHILGIRVTHDRKYRTITLDQTCTLKRSSADLGCKTVLPPILLQCQGKTLIITITQDG